MTYDLIGDVHGQFLKLKNVLEHLGYEKKKGVYSKKNHCAIFIGDLVDRGERVREVVGLVKNMVEEGHAEAIMGNHEYNLFGYITKNEKGKPLRSNNDKNTKQVKLTLESYNGKDSILEEHLHWISQLPLYINKTDFRAVHACWDKKSVEFIKNGVGRIMNESILRESYKCGSSLETAVKMLLTGPEIKIPNNIKLIDSDGHRRLSMRYKWWEKVDGKTYQEIAIKDADKFPDELINSFKKQNDKHYSEKRKPLFFGHYSMKGKANLMKQNVCCLDWVSNNENRIAVYRFNGERKLKQKNLKFLSK